MPGSAAAELQRFVLRAQALALYRQFMRIARTLPQEARGVQ
jgi:hypothetical protein